MTSLYFTLLHNNDLLDLCMCINLSANVIQAPIRAQALSVASAIATPLPVSPLGLSITLG